MKLSGSPMVLVYLIICLVPYTLVSGTPVITYPLSSGSSTKTVPEDTATGVPIDTVLPTTATWTYAITAPASNPFSINVGGTVQAATPLDFDTAPTSYALTIRVTDTADSNFVDVTLTIILSNVFDVTPSITGTATATMAEEEAVGTTLTTSYVVNDAETSYGDILTYSLIGPGATYFNIDPSTGDITVKSRIDFDPAAGISSLAMTVQVSDIANNIGTLALTVTITDINDNAPICSPALINRNILENTADGTNVANIVCTDIDSAANNALTYTIFSGDDTPPKFQIAAAGTAVTTLPTPLDYESVQSYTLVIHVVDGAATGKLTGTVTCVVQVLPKNDNDPTWGTNIPAGSAFSVSESSPLTTSIVTLKADDADLGTDGDLTYSIVSVTANTGVSGTGVFSVNPTSGEFTVASALDRESAQSYDVVVRATDGGASPTPIDDTLTITITDVNDNAPTFTAASVLSATILETSGAGTSIALLVASDLDATSTLTFVVTGGDLVPNKFEFSGTTLGQLQLASTIDIDKPTNEANSYSLTVEVTDGGASELTGTTYVTVTITGVNDNNPVLNTPVPASTVPVAENGGAGFFVATVTGTDNDFGVDGELTYTITNGNTAGMFSIDGTKGDIRTTASLDFDVNPIQYILEVTATDGGGQAVATTLTVDVTNVNDNDPVCTSYFVTQSVAEDAAVNSVVATLSCTDADPPDTLTYSITGGNTPVVFSVVAGTSKIENVQALDYEAVTEYTLTVTVTDDGSTPNADDVTVKILVTPVNEFPPVFSPSTYTPSVVESVAVGAAVVTVTATDNDKGNLDGTIRYSITNGDPQGSFVIDETTGDITTARTLNREGTASFSLEITAFDDAAAAPTQNVVTQLVTVTVTDANDNSPVFNPAFYTASPIETAAALSALLVVTATDDDEAATANSNLVFTITGGDTGGTFDFSGTTLRLAAGKSLDFATTPVYDLIVQAADQGTGPLTDTARILINVQPANQNAPIFSNPNSVVNVNETVAVGSTVLTSQALDGDSGIFGSVTYTITAGNVPADSFIIGGASGDVLVWSQMDFDAPPSAYNLTLTATDGGGTSTSTWLVINLVDVNDNVPQFPSNIINIAINENLSNPTIFSAVVATDGDTGTNGAVEYSITSGDGAAVFSIDTTTGDLSTIAAIDYETKTTYNLVIQALDKGTPTANSATVLVNININDVNDNAPIFTPIDFSVALTENVATGTSVVKMAAADADSVANSNGLFTYSLTSTVFAIDAATGIITTILGIDRELNTSFILSVLATDQNGVGANVGTATVTVNVVDVNDNNPVITGTYGKVVPENTAVGSIIHTITAVDADIGRNAELAFSITGGDPNNDFFIEPVSGILMVSKALNRENKSSYTLGVTVTDNGVLKRASTVNVVLTISDVNDNVPVFQNLPYAFQIAENVPSGSNVAFVTALDADTGVNGAVVYDFVIFWQGNSTHFSVAGGSGQVITNGGLDRELQDTYLIWLRASDNGVPVGYANVNITITILDLNDNTPVFDADSYAGVISESDVVGKSVLKMVITDKDIGVNAAVTLSIENLTNEGIRANTFFVIDSVTGVLSIKAVVDRETDPSFTFTVLAVDGGTTARTNTTTVTITVLDVNDNAPVMSPTFYNTEVAYNGICDGTITTVTATDADSALNGQVIYYLIQSTNNYLFNLDTNTGVLSLQSTAAANNFRYSIQASARDAGTPVRTALTPVIIRIDTFDPNGVAVTFRLNIDQATFVSQQATFLSELQALIRVTYTSAILRVWCIEARTGTSGFPSTGRRRLLQSTSPVNVHVVTVADSATESAGNIAQDKTFLTSTQTLQFFSTSSSGTPSAAVTGANLGSFSISSVTPYYQIPTPWAQTGEGIAILTVISIIIVALIVTGIIVTIYTCRKRERSIAHVNRRPRAMEQTTEKQGPNDVYKSKTPPPEYSETPLPMKPGDDGVSNYNYSYSRGHTGRAVDPVSHKVYSYNTKTNDRQWLTTPEGRSVKVTHH